MAELESLSGGFVSMSVFVITAVSVFLFEVSFNCGSDVPVLLEEAEVLSEVDRREDELLESLDCTSLCSGFIGSTLSCTCPS